MGYKDRNCDWCGVSFSPKSSTTKYCCPAHSRLNFLFGAIPDDFHTSDKSGVEFAREYLVSKGCKRKVYSSRIDMEVVIKSPNAHKVVGVLQQVNALPDSIGSLNEKLLFFVDERVTPHPKEEPTHPYVDKIEAINKDPSPETLLGKAFASNGVLYKFMRVKSERVELFGDAFEKFVKGSEEVFGVFDSRTFRRYLMGERTHPTCECCGSKLRLPNGVEEWTKYCSKKCSGTGMQSNINTNKFNPDEMELLTDRGFLTYMLEASNGNIEIMSGNMPFDIHSTTLGQYLAKMGIEPPSAFGKSSVNEWLVEGWLEGKNYVKGYRPGWLDMGKRPHEIDFYLPDLRIGIELHGEYWHSELFKPKLYHHEKFRKCEENGVRLIQVFQHQLLGRKTFWSNYFQNLGKERKIYARKTVLKPVPSTIEKSFFESNHYKGHVNSTICLGLYTGDELVLACSFKRPRFHHEEGYMELIRMATKIGVRVVGGASKVLSHAMEGVERGLVSYCDLSFGGGGVYHSTGFEEVGQNIDHFYFNKKSRAVVSRYELMKFSSEEIMNLDFVKVHGAGNRKFIKKKGG